MEPVSSIVSAIFKVLQEIARAERAARRNRARCRDLARRAEAVSGVLRDCRAGARSDAAATRRVILCRLREALGDALRLVESCAERDDGRLFAWLFRLMDSRSRADKFDDVDKRINNCLAELSAASGASIEKKIDRLAVVNAARHEHHPRANKQKEAQAGNAPQNGATGNGGKGGKRRRGKKKAAAANPPLAHGAGVPFRPSAGHGHAACRQSVHEDPDSCSVM